MCLYQRPNWLTAFDPNRSLDRAVGIRSAAMAPALCPSFIVSQAAATHGRQVDVDTNRPQRSRVNPHGRPAARAQRHGTSNRIREIVMRAGRMIDTVAARAGPALKVQTAKPSARYPAAARAPTSAPANIQDKARSGR